MKSPNVPISRSAPENVQFQSRLRSSLRLKRVIPAQPGFPAGRRKRLFAAFSEEGIHAQRARRQATQSSVRPRAAGLFWQRYEQPERLKPVSIVGRKAACSETTFSLKSMGTAVPNPAKGLYPGNGIVVQALLSVSDAPPAFIRHWRRRVPVPQTPPGT